jgi:hypothetical protein
MVAGWRNGQGLLVIDVVRVGGPGSVVKLIFNGTDAAERIKGLDLQVGRTDRLRVILLNRLGLGRAERSQELYRSIAPDNLGAAKIV